MPWFDHEKRPTGMSRFPIASKRGGRRGVAINMVCYYAQCSGISYINWYMKFELFLDISGSSFMSVPCMSVLMEQSGGPS